jgi:hypothetical protein
MTSFGLEELRTALLANARPGQHPRDLLKAVRRSHPKATKSEVVRAAFYTVIDLADADNDMVRILHDFAITARGEPN